MPRICKSLTRSRLTWLGRQPKQETEVSSALTTTPKPSDLLSEIAATRGWESPDRGVALGRVRLTQAERERAFRFIKRGIDYGLPGRSVPALVCLLACEALQRRTGGQAWSWHNLREQMRGVLDALDDARLRVIVRDGLPVWGREVRRGTDGDWRYLHSLVLEAGIPASLVARKEFGEFLRAVQRDADACGDATAVLARRHVMRLPPAWRQDDTVELAAELLNALAPYREALGGGCSDLDKRFPDWRHGLPLDMSDAAAEQLVQALLARPKVVAKQELRTLCRRVLWSRNGEWHPSLMAQERGLLPAALTTRHLFTDGNVIRVRFAVDGEQLAVAERCDDVVWEYRSVRTRPVALPFDQPVTAALLVDGNERERMALPGGDALQELPWVLVQGEGGTLDFAGYGSVAVPGQEVFLAVRPDRGRLDVRAGEVTPVGRIAGSHRSLFRVEGEAWWREEGNEHPVRLRTGVQDGSPSLLGIVATAPRWDVQVPLASVGQPVVARCPPKQVLLWRPRRSGEGWKPYRGTLPEGVESELALVENGVLVDRRRIVILPLGADAKLRSRPGMLEVELRNLGAEWCVLDGFPTALQSRDGDAFRISARFTGPAPAEVVARTGHPGGLELRHRLRVPMPNGGFVRVSGGTLGSNHVAAVVDLPQMLARAGAYDASAELEICSTMPGGAKVGRVLRFVEDLPLGRLRGDLQRLHTTAGSPDGEVRLRVLRGGMSDAGIRVRAFDRDLDISYGIARLGQGQGLETGGLGALALTRPDQAIVELPPSGDGAGSGWVLGTLPGHGPWLLVGTGTLAGHVRPRVWAHGTQGTEAACRLARAALLPDAARRAAAMDSVMLELSSDPESPEAAEDWEFLSATLEMAARHAPARFFDVLLAAARAPAVLARWALRAKPELLNRLATLEDQVPFLWSLVPLEHWRRAAMEFAAQFERYGIALTSLQIDPFAEWAASCPSARAGIWAARDALGMTQPPGQPATLAQLGASAPFLKLHAGPDPGEAAWRSSVYSVRDWTNLPDTVRHGAPHAAARHALGQAILSPQEATAVRVSRDKAPDEYDGHVLFATLMRLGMDGVPQ